MPTAEPPLPWLYPLIPRSSRQLQLQRVNERNYERFGSRHVAGLAT